MRIALAQVDCILGDTDANLHIAERMIKEATTQSCDLVVFPELNLSGYALGRLTDDISLQTNDPRIEELSRYGPDVLLGIYEDAGLRRYNSAAYYSDGALVHLHRKLYLPNYLIWEERKHANPGQRMRAFDTRHARVAALVCNDAWQPMLPWLAAQDGAQILLVPTNSAMGLVPGSVDTIAYWKDLLLFNARMQQCWVIFVNRVGEEAGATFWGGSQVIDPWGRVVAEAPEYEPSLTVVDIDVSAVRRRRREMPLLQEARLGLLRREVERLMSEHGEE